MVFFYCSGPIIRCQKFRGFGRLLLPCGSPLWCAVDTLWVYIVYVLSTCLNRRTLFIPCSAETLPHNCSWSPKEHHQHEGQPSEQLYWATRKDFKKKGTKKGNKHSGLFDSLYQKWGFPVGLRTSLASGLYYFANGKHLKYL